MKVLYADSDAEVRDYVSMLLEAGLDCEILEASSGNEALSVLEFDSEIDFVISEVHMHGGNGNLIVDYLDNHAMIIPIVWLSDKKNAKEPYVKEVLQRSALNAFVPKPFRDDQFFPVIDKILEIKQELNEGWNSGSSNSSPFSEGSPKKDNHEFDWDVKGNQSKESVADWSVAKKKNRGGSEEADWSLAKKGQQGEGVADWSLKAKGGGTEGEADWSLKANGDGTEGEADWSLLAKGEGDEENADWTLKNQGNAEDNVADFRGERKNSGEQTLDYSQGNPGGETWERIRQGSASSNTEAEYDKERFRRIRLKRFYNFDKVCCDVYIQLSAKKYVKLLNANDIYENYQIEKYEEKGKKFLFIETIHYQRFQKQFGNLVLDKLEKAQNLPPEVKVVAELAAFDHVLNQAREFGITPITANQVMRSVESNLKTLKKLPKLEALLKRIMRGGDYISEHSLMLSYFAGQICMATSWGNHQSLEKLSMAALIHDVFLDDERLAQVHDLKEAKVKGFSSEEIEKIKSHPGEAAKVINEGESIFPDVDTIVIQHHEQPDQSGFPRGLGALSISPLSCVFIIASELTEKVYGNKAEEVNMEAIKAEFQEKFNRGNFKKPLEAFLKVF